MREIWRRLAFSVSFSLSLLLICSATPSAAQTPGEIRPVFTEPEANAATQILGIGLKAVELRELPQAAEAYVAIMRKMRQAAEEAKKPGGPQK